MDYGDIVSFRFLKMASVTFFFFVEFLNSLILLTDRVQRNPIRITVPNFVKIGQSIVEILQFFVF